MQFAAVFDSLTTWGHEHTLQLLISLVLLVVYVIVDRLSAPRIAKIAVEGGFTEGAGDRAIRIIRSMTGLISALVLGRPSLINPRDRLHGIGKLPPLKSNGDE